MLCKNPYRQGVMEYGCGQCIKCRIDRRRLWSSRLMLEAREHKAALFVTLTYREEKLPDGATLVPKHMQDFLKRLRFHCDPMRIRYYGVGEYGERRGRPHYHLALFGADYTKFFDGFGITRRLDPTRFECKVWPYGHVDVRQLSWDLAWYIGGYICKRWTKDDWAKDKLNGRHPEFARMSLKPGIGAVAVADLAAALNNWHGVRYISQNGDVPYIVQMHGKKLPMGRYLMRKLREECGYPPEVPEGVLRRKAGEMVLEVETQKLRDAREATRVQHDRNAKARWSISQSKREF